MKTVLMLLACLSLTGCYTAKFIRSTPDQVAAKPVDQVLVFYSPDAVPFQYRELGRIFARRRYGSYGPEDEANQIEKIKETAAAQGADGVIIQVEHRSVSSAAYAPGIGGTASSEDAISVTGSAIVKK